jgi:hypothetical protein
MESRGGEQSGEASRTMPMRMGSTGGEYTVGPAVNPELAHRDCWGFHGELEHVNKPVPSSTPSSTRVR